MRRLFMIGLVGVMVGVMTIPAGAGGPAAASTCTASGVVLSNAGTVRVFQTSATNLTVVDGTDGADHVKVIADGLTVTVFADFLAEPQQVTFTSSTNSMAVRVHGCEGTDHIVLGDGFDIKIVHGDDGNDNVNTGNSAFSNTLWGGDGNDKLIAGDAGNGNVLYGQEGNDQLTSGYGGYGSEMLGGPGNDFLDAGNAGVRNRLLGQNGNDRLVAGDAGEDILLDGGDGNDTCLAGSAPSVIETAC